MKKQNLTAANRGAIEILLQKNFTPAEIAKEIGFDKSTICREIRNRSTPNGYFAEIAELDYQTKRKKSKRRKKLDYSKHRDYVLGKLRIGWSPEEISGRLRNIETEVGLQISHEAIYQFIYGDEYCRQEKIYQYLRYGRKRRKKQTGRSVHRQKIPNRVSIHERPKVVEERREFGHFEGDTVHYVNKKGIATLNELMTGLVIFRKLSRKTAEITNNQIVLGIKSSNYEVKSITFDNGNEFSNHEGLSGELNVKIYFADPYSSWQRGSNENCNMLLRGYLPKRSNIDNLTQSELDDIVEELNNRPRKRLGYKTPLEAYQEVLVKCCNRN